MRFLDVFSGSAPRTKTLGERDRLGRRVARLAPRFLADCLPAIFLQIGGLGGAAIKKQGRDVFGGTPNTAGETPALPRIAGDRAIPLKRSKTLILI
jgi:hypothetical protein